MKTIAATALLGLAVSVIGAGDVLQQLRVPKNDASREMISSLVHGSVNVSRVRGAFRSASPEARAALVEQTLIWTRAYVESPQFAKDYAAYREEMKPQPPERTTTVDEELEAKRKEREESLAETKKAIAEMPAEYRKMAEDGYKASVEAMKQLDNPQFRKMEREQIVRERQQEDEQYAERVAEWEEEYPADPKVLVKQRLEDLLEETDGVDFAAKLNGRKFADRRYEAKSSEWKLAYRAGQPAVEKARAFAEKWLKEL